MVSQGKALPIHRKVKGAALGSIIGIVIAGTLSTLGVALTASEAALLPAVFSFAFGYLASEPGGLE